MQTRDVLFRRLQPKAAFFSMDTSMCSLYSGQYPLKPLVIGQTQRPFYAQIYNRLRLKGADLLVQNVNITAHHKFPAFSIPSVFSNPARLYIYRPALPLNFHQQDMAWIIPPETVLFGGSAIPGSFVNFHCSVPVAQCQIIKPRRLCAVSGNWVCRIETFRQIFQNAAVSKPYA